MIVSIVVHSQRLFWPTSRWYVLVYKSNTKQADTNAIRLYLTPAPLSISSNVHAPIPSRLHTLNVSTGKPK
jgi:hypothetical protein